MRTVHGVPKVFTFRVEDEFEQFGKASTIEYIFVGFVGVDALEGANEMRYDAFDFLAAHVTYLARGRQQISRFALVLTILHFRLHEPIVIIQNTVDKI